MCEKNRSFVAENVISPIFLTIVKTFENLNVNILCVRRKRAAKPNRAVTSEVRIFVPQALEKINSINIGY